MKVASKNEEEARKIVENHLMVRLKYVDVSGQVDYLNHDGEDFEMALEVTRFTDQDKFQLSTMDVANKYVVERMDIHHNWWINIRGVPNFRKLELELYPFLVDLEIHGLREVNLPYQGWWLEKVPTLRRAYEGLRNNHVENITSRIGMFSNQNFEETRLIAITSSENWIFGDANATLELIESFLESNKNDRRKLSESGKSSRHEFIWIDEYSPKPLREMFDREDVQLPSRVAELPDEISDLWVADSVRKLAMYFNATGLWTLISFDLL
jgi:hypothetical protein